MPVFFYIDPEFATDPRLKGVDNLTLSYTFFKVGVACDPCRRCCMWTAAPPVLAPGHTIHIGAQVDEDKETPQEALARILAAHPDQHSELLPRQH